jgi:hypothetical protein
MPGLLATKKQIAANPNLIRATSATKKNLVKNAESIHLIYFIYN